MDDVDVQPAVKRPKSEGQQSSWGWDLLPEQQRMMQLMALQRSQFGEPPSSRGAVEPTRLLQQQRWPMDRATMERDTRHSIKGSPVDIYDNVYELQRERWQQQQQQQQLAIDADHHLAMAAANLMAKRLSSGPTATFAGAKHPRSQQQLQLLQQELQMQAYHVQQEGLSQYSSQHRQMAMRAALPMNMASQPDMEGDDEQPSYYHRPRAGSFYKATTPPQAPTEHPLTEADFHSITRVSNFYKIFGLVSRGDMNSPQTIRPETCWRYRDHRNTLKRFLEPAHHMYITKHNPELWDRLPREMKLGHFAQKILDLSFHFLLKDGTKLPSYWSKLDFMRLFSILKFGESQPPEPQDMPGARLAIAVRAYRLVRDNNRTHLPSPEPVELAVKFATEEVLSWQLDDNTLLQSISDLTQMANLQSNEIHLVHLARRNAADANSQMARLLGGVYPNHPSTASIRDKEMSAAPSSSGCSSDNAVQPNSSGSSSSASSGSNHSSNSSSSTSSSSSGSRGSHVGDDDTGSNNSTTPAGTPSPATSDAAAANFRSSSSKASPPSLPASTPPSTPAASSAVERVPSNSQKPDSTPATKKVLARPRPVVLNVKREQKLFPINHEGDHRTAGSKCSHSSAHPNLPASMAAYLNHLHVGSPGISPGALNFPLTPPSTEFILPPVSLSDQLFDHTTGGDRGDAKRVCADGQARTFNGDLNEALPSFSEVLQSTKPSSSEARKAAEAKGARQNFSTLFETLTDQTQVSTEDDAMAETPGAAASPASRSRKRAVKALLKHPELLEELVTKFEQNSQLPDNSNDVKALKDWLTIQAAGALAHMSIEERPLQSSQPTSPAAADARNAVTESLPSVALLLKEAADAMLKLDQKPVPSPISSAGNSPFATSTSSVFDSSTGPFRSNHNVQTPSFDVHHSGLHHELRSLLSPSVPFESGNPSSPFCSMSAGTTPSAVTANIHSLEFGRSTRSKAVPMGLVPVTPPCFSATPNVGATSVFSKEQ